MAHDEPATDRPRASAPGDVVRVTVNGAPRELARGATVVDLVAALGLRPELVAVEVERALVPRREHAARVLADGERVEIVTLVGGG